LFGGRAAAAGHGEVMGWRFLAPSIPGTTSSECAAFSTCLRLFRLPVHRGDDVFGGSQLDAQGALRGVFTKDLFATKNEKPNLQVETTPSVRNLIVLLPKEPRVNGWNPCSSWQQE